jgi:hypothetical protein
MLLLIINPTFTAPFPSFAPEVWDFEQRKQNTWVYQFRLTVPAYHAETHVSEWYIVAMAEETHSRYYWQSHSSWFTISHWDHGRHDYCFNRMDSRSRAGYTSLFHKSDLGSENTSGTTITLSERAVGLEPIAFNWLWSRAHVQSEITMRTLIDLSQWEAGLEATVVQRFTNLTQR